MRLRANDITPVSLIFFIFFKVRRRYTLTRVGTTIEGELHEEAHWKLEIIHYISKWCSRTPQFRQSPRLLLDVTLSLRQRTPILTILILYGMNPPILPSPVEGLHSRAGHYEHRLRRCQPGMAAMSLPPSGWEALGERPLFCGTLFPDLPNEMTAVAVTQTAPNPLPLAISQGKAGKPCLRVPSLPRRLGGGEGGR